MDKYPRGGVTLTDGSVVWIVDDIRDGLTVGGIGLDYVLKSGRVKGNGALLQRASYPRLFEWVQDNAAVQTTEALWTNNKHLYTLGDGAISFRIPDLRGKWLQMADGVGQLAAGAPAIRGTISTSGYSGLANGTGAFKATGSAFDTGGDVKYGYSGIADFDAERSSSVYGAANTIQPPSVQLIGQIKY